MTVVRKAAEQDLNAVVSLWSSLISFHHDLDRRFWLQADDGEETALAWLGEALAKPGRLLLVAEQDGVVVGFLHGLLRNAPVPMAPRLSGYITDVVVAAKHARQGNGTALLAAAEEWFVAQGAEDVVMTVAVYNQRARRFWLKHGFEPWTLNMRRSVKAQ
jgi:ribosomal protein S18 acetylase RimI-like enzyme